MPTIADSNCYTTCTCDDCDILKKYIDGSWFVVETDNFQIRSNESETHALHLARHAEALRIQLQAKWLDTRSSHEKSQCRCQIVLHANRRSYTAAVGRGSEKTVGSSLVNVHSGRIQSARIDLLGGHTKFLSTALPHELTHVLLKERYPSIDLPRWADEGMAILADSETKQRRHLNDLHDAMVQGTTFDLALLVGIEEYPPYHRWGVFYGQSLSVTEFLIRQHSPEQFVNFIELVAHNGYDAALRDCYGIDNLGALDRQWRQELHSPRTSKN
jgi:hypothetical protein